MSSTTGGLERTNGVAPFVLEASQWSQAETGVEPSGDVPLPPPEGGASEERRRILVADDNADMREYLVRLLRPYWTVDAVSDGEAALALRCWGTRATTCSPASSIRRR
jgi:hypothetical protein